VQCYYGEAVREDDAIPRNYILVFITIIQAEEPMKASTLPLFNLRVFCSADSPLSSVDLVNTPFGRVRAAYSLYKGNYT
jgi:hypothetical protein